MDSLQLTHSLVNDFLIKQFGPKVASRVYKSKIKSPSDIGGEVVDLEAFVRENYAASLDRKRKLDGTPPAGTKKAKLADKQQGAGGHSSSSSETSDDDGEVNHENTTTKATPNATGARSVPPGQLSTSSTSDSSEVENGKLKGKTQIAPNQTGRMPAAKRGGKAAILAAEESDSSTDTAPAIGRNVPAMSTRSSSTQQKKSSESREGGSKGAAGLLTPRSCVIQKQAGKMASNKENVSLEKNLASRKSVALSTTAGRDGGKATAKGASAAVEDSSDSSDDSSSAEAAPVRKLTSGLPVEGKNQQSSSSDSSSEEEAVGDKDKVILAKRPQTSKSNLPVPGKGGQPSEKPILGKANPVKQVASETSSSSESSSSDENAVETGTTKVVARSAGTLIRNKAASSSEDSSSEDDSSDEIENNVKIAAPPRGTQPAEEDSSSSDSSSSEEDAAIRTQKPLIGSEKKPEHVSIVQRVAKQKAKESSSSDSSSSEDESLPKTKPSSERLANFEVKKNIKSVEEFIKQAEQDVSSASESSSSEEDSSQSEKQPAKVSKVEQSALNQKAKAAAVADLKGKSSSPSRNSMGELTRQLKDKVARSISKKTAVAEAKKNIALKSKETVQEDSSSSSSEEDLLAKGFDGSLKKVEGFGGKGNSKKTAPTPVRQQPEKDTSSSDSSTSEEDAIEKKKTLTNNSRKVETNKTNVGVKKNVSLVSKQNLAEVSSSSSSESSSDEDLAPTGKHPEQGSFKKVSNQPATDWKKSSAGANIEKKQLASKTGKMTSDKSVTLNDTDTSDETSSDDESVEQEDQKLTKATTGLVKAMETTKSQQVVAHSSSSSSSSESSSEENTVGKITGNVNGKASSVGLGKQTSITGKRTQKSVGASETNAESKQHVKSPKKPYINKTEPASKKEIPKTKVLPTADMSAATELSPNLTASSTAKKKRRGSTSAETAALSSTDAKRRCSTMNSSVGALVHDAAVKLTEGNAEQVVGGASSKLSKSAEAIRNNGPYRRFTAGKDQLNQEFRDNSYRAKKGDTWGKRAYEDLAPVKGKNFRKEKTKKKRGSYKGGKIDPNAIGSIRFPDDDE
ncbi:Nucleolar and coiled body phosphoprotein 1 [Trichuris trichiura]|uniref:Nucleolar and coiled body phosphoprotein 1 n=1 Tax=Trichuris trichiura TaxID=36087 RepID=A0A077ZBQ7_TRITR|nr:Nucleolar and coiled body phosphoprotein 1 [Trichuris trichiura]